MMTKKEIIIGVSVGIIITAVLIFFISAVTEELVTGAKWLDDNGGLQRIWTGKTK